MEKYIVVEMGCIRDEISDPMSYKDARKLFKERKEEMELELRNKVQIRSVMLTGKSRS